jgi:amidase
MRPLLVVLAVIALTDFRLSASQAPTFRLVKASIPEMQAAMAAGSLTSRGLVTQYLVRLALYEDRLNAALYVNPRALDEAAPLDRQRAQGRVRGPLHGIPVALKTIADTSGAWG